MLEALIETFAGNPRLSIAVVFFIALGYGVIRLSRFSEKFEEQQARKQAEECFAQQRDNAYEEKISSYMEKVNDFTYQGEDVNLDDVYDCNYRNDNDGIISVCNEMIDYAERNKEFLSKKQLEELDFFYFRRAEAHEFLGNYELAVADYKESQNIFYDKETEQMLERCYQKLNEKNS